MKEILRYILSSFLGALEKATSKLGFGIEVFFITVTLVVYHMLDWSSAGVRDDLILIFDALIVLLLFFFIWELQKVFPRINASKRNSLDGAELFIVNNEVVDLTDLEVELFQRAWISKNGTRTVFHINPGNRLFEVWGDPIVRYDRGEKLVLIGSGRNETATFQLKTEQLDTSFETDGKTDTAVYNVVIRIKGKISGRTIYPRRITGTLKYQRTPQEFQVPQPNGTYKLEKNVYSRMKWEDPDYKGSNFD